MTASNIVLVFATTCTALMAGLFYSYYCSVIPGLKLLADPAYISSMQSINKAIQNPIFFLCFFGVLILLPVSTYLNYLQPPSLRFWLLLISTILYFIGVFGVTVFGNIPLNNMLEKFSLSNAAAETISFQRKIFEKQWNNFNAIRTVSSIFSLILIIIACINPNKNL